VGNDTAALRTDNPAAGDWQIYGLDPILAAEGKMSTKGNQLALKTALRMKPNFAEKQSVALRKIEASIDSVKHALKQTESIANKGKVIVIDPSGKKFRTTKENAMNLPEGWRHG
jgi:hypothetical protein